MTYLLTTGSGLGAGVLLEAMVDKRLEELSPLRFRTVLTRERTLPRPFFSFSSLGTEAPGCAGELIMATVG